MYILITFVYLSTVTEYAIAHLQTEATTSGKHVVY